MSDRPTAPAKLLPLLVPDGPLAGALAGVWGVQGPTVGQKLGLGAAQLDRLHEECLVALRSWTESDNPVVAKRDMQGWLARLRQDISLEGMWLVLVHLDRALRQAGWQLGLAAPDWLALSELCSGFMEALFQEAAAGWHGLLGQNQQLRSELAYFRTLAEALASGEDLSALLDVAVRETAHVLHCEFCAVLLPRDDDRDVLVVRSAVAPRIMTRALDGMAFPLAENGLIAQVFLTGAPASTYQPLEDLEVTIRRRQTLEGLGFTQLMAFPLQSQGRVLGVLCVANRLDDRAWQSIEEDWLEVLAAQLAVGIRVFQQGADEGAGAADLVAIIERFLRRKDARLAAQGEAVGRLAASLGGALGLGQAKCEGLGMAGRLHALGQLFVPDAVRHRAEAGWTGRMMASGDAAWRRQLPIWSAELLAGLPGVDRLAGWVRHHHERWDGSGFPDGLRGQAIPLESRILAVAAAYVDLTRPYALGEALGVDAARESLARVAGLAYDPLVVQALGQCQGELSPALETVVPWVPTDPNAEPVADEPVLDDFHPATLLALLDELVGAVGESETLARFWGVMASAARCDAVAVWRMRGVPRLTLATALGWEAGNIDRAPNSDSLESYVAACRVPVAVPDLALEPRFPIPNGVASAGLKSAMAFPLVLGDRVVGVLTVYRREASNFAAREQAGLELAAAMLAIGLEAQDLLEQREGAGDRDPLTGLASHRGFAGRLDIEVDRAATANRGFGAVLLDLDGFDDFVSRHGYGLGDEVLRMVAAAVDSVVLNDSPLAIAAARLAADTFAVLLPGADVAESMAVGERLRREIAAMRMPARTPGGARLTASIGVTAHAGAGLTRRDVLDDLHHALAQARREGTNRLVFHARTRSEM